VSTGSDSASYVNLLLDAPSFVREALAPGALRDAGLFAPEVVMRLRAALELAPARHVLRLRLELVLMLVLGTQLLHRQFIAGAAPAPRFALPEG
jgi:asparagine synthase (glutamine-hydrolysing)